MAGAENVQGLIAEGHAELGCEPRYILQWPNAEKLGDAGLFTMIVGEVSQAELVKAQAVDVVSPCGPIDHRSIESFKFSPGELVEISKLVPWRVSSGKTKNAHGKAASKSRRRSQAKRKPSRKSRR